MARSQHTFSKRQREKDKQKKNKEKREKRDERRVEKSEGESNGPTIDWDLAPVNNTLSKEDEAKKAVTKTKTKGEEDS